MKPETIDLAYAGETCDGAPIFAPPGEALTMHITRGAAWLLMEHSREALHALGLVALMGLCMWWAKK